MKKIQKVLVAITIVSVSLVILMLILALFGIKIFDNEWAVAILLTLSLLGASCFFFISSINIYDKNKLLSLISMSLLSILSVFALIIFWSYFEINEVFSKITCILGLITILFIIIVTTNIKLEKRYQILQVITYMFITILDIILIIVICGGKLFENDLFVKLFVAFCLVTFGLLCTIKIVSGKKGNSKFITINRSEYNELLERIALLEKENENLKNK